jgi:hypothetical protein
MLLDGLVADVERLRDLPVRAALGGQRRGSTVVGGAGIDAAELWPGWPRAGDQQLGAGALGERRGVAADSEIKCLAERLACVDDAAAVPERDAEVGERAGVLEPRRRGAKHLHRLGQLIGLVADTPSVGSAIPIARAAPKRRASSSSSRASASAASGRSSAA